MSTLRPIRKRISVASCRVFLMCATALCCLMALYAPQGLASTAVRSTVNSHAHPGHRSRQLFDHEDSQWAAPPGPNLATPLPVELPHPPRIAEAFVEIVMDALHYNRPPPISCLPGLS